MSRTPHNLMSAVAFSILFALSLKPRHGYELMQQIELDSRGKVKLGPGALYGSIKQLRDDNYIEEMPYEGNDRRRYYRLTKKGWDQLSAEMDHYAHTVELARERKVLPEHMGGLA